MAIMVFVVSDCMGFIRLVLILVLIEPVEIKGKDIFDVIEKASTCSAGGFDESNPYISLCINYCLNKTKLNLFILH